MLFLRIQIVSTPYSKDGACLSLKKKLFYGHFHKNKKEKKKPHNTIIQSITNYYSGF